MGSTEQQLAFLAISTIIVLIIATFFKIIDLYQKQRVVNMY